MVLPRHTCAGVVLNVYCFIGDSPLPGISCPSFSLNVERPQTSRRPTPIEISTDLLIFRCTTWTDCGCLSLLFCYSIIIAVVGVPGVLLGAGLIEIPRFGRKWAMVVSSALMGTSLFLYATITSTAASVGFNAMEYFCTFRFLIIDPLVSKYA